MRVIRDRCQDAVAAWGTLITQVSAGEGQVERIKRELSPLYCLGTTKAGHPKHPLYLAADTPLVEWSPKALRGER